MTTTVSIAYTIDAANLTLTDTGRVMGTVTGLALGDLQNRDPVAYAAMTEFNSLGTTSGTITIVANRGEFASLRVFVRNHDISLALFPGTLDNLQVDLGYTVCDVAQAASDTTADAKIIAIGIEMAWNDHILFRERLKRFVNPIAAVVVGVIKRIPVIGRLGGLKRFHFLRSHPSASFLLVAPPP